MGNRKGSDWALNLGLCNKQQEMVAASIHLLSWISLMLGAVQEEIKKNYLCVCVWKGCDPASRTKQLVSSSQGQRGKDYGQVFQAENTHQLNPASPPCPPAPVNPAPQASVPWVSSHWPWASYVEPIQLRLHQRLLRHCSRPVEDLFII